MDFHLFLATIFTLLCTIIYMVYGKLRVQENNIIASSSSPPSPQSSLSLNRNHHVFSSFHGVDVRRSFLSHILKEFRSKGINPFIDNEITRGEFIGPELKQAIQGSKIAIVLLSKNYASSSWCLDELVEIMKCKEVLGQTVIAIYYEVDPSDVKKKVGEFEKVFRKTCVGKTNEVILKWRQALEKVATIAGYHSSNWVDDAAMIEKIATDISKLLNHLTPSRDFDGLIGMGAHMRKIELLLRLDYLDEVRMVGIWGPPGIGKTTIARFLFNEVSNSFQYSAIMVNIKGSYPRPCLDEYDAQLQLQSQMLSQMINHKDIVITHLGVAQERLKDKKVFLVLDDVDQSLQLDALAKENQWFGPGSRIIITTEDLRVLKVHEINHIYKVVFPSTDEALQIFCTYAFGQKYPRDGFTELAHEVTYLAGKLPLGLKVMGSYFRGMSKQDWTKELPRLRKNLHKDIESVLKFSYDALCDDDKDLFLHIACFFDDGEIDKVEEHLSKRYSSDVRQGLHVLAERSLISMELSYITMHSLLVKLGREIVRKQSIHEPGRRQFLVDSGEIHEVLIDDAANSRSVIGIDLNLSKMEEELKISERAFEGMSNLQFLRIYDNDKRGPNKLDLPRGLNYISRKLRLLQWTDFPLTCLLFIANPESLVELIMRGSKLEKLWDGIKSLHNLKWVDLSDSTYLKELPDLTTATSLQELNLGGCSSLMELPSSIGNATHLERLNLSKCSSLVGLPSSIGNATRLKELNLNKCSSLVELPFSIGNATSLQLLDLSYCSNLVELPCSIGDATNLQKLYLTNCSTLVEIPSSIGNAINLQKLYLCGCSNLMELASSIGNATDLRYLNLSLCTSLVELPLSIGNATNLQSLNLYGCSNLVEIPSSIGNATHLQQLDLCHCSSLVELPSSIGNAITNLDSLNFIGCSSLVEIPSSIENGINLRYLDFSGCSSLVELPISIGNLHKLLSLNLKGCSKLQFLPNNINMESLDSLNLSDCLSFKSFPEISTNISYLNLSGTSIEEVPSSIKSWSRLQWLQMSYFENLKEFPHALNRITELHLSDTYIQEIPPWVKTISRLWRLVLKGCKELLSLPQLPDSLSELDAENCESLERLDCSFLNPNIVLNFANCFKLNKEARDLIIQTSTWRVTVLPGGEIPTYFTYRANGGSLIVKLKERRFPSTLIFKACILLVSKHDVEAEKGKMVSVHYGIMEKQNRLNVQRSPSKRILPLTEHLHIFEFEANVISNELVFELQVDSDNWATKECGIMETVKQRRSKRK